MIRHTDTAKTLFSYFRHWVITSGFFNLVLHKKRQKRIASYYKQLSSALVEDGYVIIDGFYSENECKECVNELKHMFIKYSDYVHVSEDKRIFGVEHIASLARRFHYELEFLELGECVNKEPVFCAFTLGGWLQHGKGGSSGNGWHRDAFFSQYKAMLYLTDVNDENGPFEIIPKSHRIANVLTCVRKANIGFMQDRFTDDEVLRLICVLDEKPVKLAAKAGTVVLFNSSTIHRGSPIVDGERLALTNYYFPYSRDRRELLNKFSPVLTAGNLQQN